MENEDYEQQQQKLIDSVLNKKLEFPEEYKGQKNNPIVKKWKSEILKKYGKGGEFYYCSSDELYYYADKDEAIKNVECPNCHQYCCPYCYYSSDVDYGTANCCIKGRIRYMFLYNMYEYTNPKKVYKYIPKGKPLSINYIPFISMCNFVASWSVILFWKLDFHKKGRKETIYENNLKESIFGFLAVFILNNCFGFFICIPYFLYHYLIISILLIISIFNEKPLYGYCGMVDRGIVGG